jgi:multidrug efflux pump subunit AcrB
MNPIIAWFVRNSVAANLLMAMIVLGGLTALPQITQKPFPDIEINIVSIGVEYLGAAPAEVEEGVCIRIEEAIEGVEGIEGIRSTAVEGACAVMAELVSGADPSQALDDIKNRVDAIDTFPEEAEKPVISQVTTIRSVIDVAISGEVDELNLRAVAQRVRDEIAELPGITQVEIAFSRPFEISIEVSEDNLRRYGLSFDQVAAAVRRSSLDLPGGSIKTGGGEILLRTKGQAYRGHEFDDIVVVARRDGTRVTLGQVATVVDGFEDIDLVASFDGRPTMMVEVYRVADQDGIEISDAVKAYVAEAKHRLPEGIELVVWQDTADQLRDRIDTMTRNARSGFILVLVLLTLFLRPRLAFWVTLGVPVAFLGGLWMFLPLGISIDVISTFGFIIVLGILVDDAIVVGESVHTGQQESGDRVTGAIRGTQAVAVPVVFGVLTTIAAFTPMLLVPGPMGQIFQVMGTVVIACLVFSLVESQLILPSHLSHGHEQPERTPTSKLGRRWEALQSGAARLLERTRDQLYARLLELALEWRYTTVAAAVALLVATIGLLASGRIPFSFFPPIQADYLAARLTMPLGTPLEVTREAAGYIASTVPALLDELDPQYSKSGRPLVKHVLVASGAHPFKAKQASGPGRRTQDGSGGHMAEVVLELIPAEERTASTKEIGDAWRDRVGPVAGAVELAFASDLFSVGEAINVELQGADVDALREAATRVRAELVQYPGVVDVGDSFRAGKQEIKLAILDSAEPLGLTMQDLARQVRQAFYGEEAQRIQRGRDDVRVMVRYPAGERRSLADLEQSRIRTPAGAEVPFTTVARAELGRGFSTIRRTDRKRVVNVTADVDREKTTANLVLADLQASKLPPILADFPSVSYRLEGMSEQQSQATGGLLSASVIAILAIYALLAIPLRSYTQPLLIMVVIPFGLIGAIGGHLVTFRDLSFMSVIGIVALSGVVVNASLVLVHYVNGRREAGESVVEAARTAGLRRFRPIVLTSLTTFVGLTPMLLEQSVQAQFLIPMATSLAFGVLFATVITLLVVPCGYLILEDLHALSRRWRPLREPLSVPLEPHRG